MAVRDACACERSTQHHYLAISGAKTFQRDVLALEARVKCAYEIAINAIIAGNLFRLQRLQPQQLLANVFACCTCDDDDIQLAYRDRVQRERVRSELASVQSANKYSHNAESTGRIKLTSRAHTHTLSLCLSRSLSHTFHAREIDAEWFPSAGV